MIAMHESMTLSSTDQRLLDALRTSGPFTLDTLSTMCDISWSDAFVVVDRLSRSRHVTLHRTESREYLISINTNAAVDDAVPASGYADE
ncbi:hypothetical protein [Nitrospira sp. Nam74]